MYVRFVKATIEMYKKKGFQGIFVDLRGAKEAIWEKDDKILVGKDSFGNEYYTTTGLTTFMRDRWVVFNGKHESIYDASDISPGWHAWLHRQRDDPPKEEERYYTNGEKKGGFLVLIVEIGLVIMKGDIYLQVIF